MPGKSQPAQIPLPKSWDACVKSAILHIIALAQYALTYSRSWAADSTNQRVRLKAENDRLEQERSLREEELRIKDLRMGLMPPARRPHYPPTARMAILELRATRGWSLEQTAKAFLVTANILAFSFSYCAQNALTVFSKGAAFESQGSSAGKNFLRKHRPSQSSRGIEATLPARPTNHVQRHRAG